MIGVILLTLTLFMSFTGYLLPWDQLAIWAVTVGTNMARAHPIIGHEGPGAGLLKFDDSEFDDFDDDPAWIGDADDGWEWIDDGDTGCDIDDDDWEWVHEDA